MAMIQLFSRESKTYREFEALNADHRDAYHLSNRYEAALYSMVEAAGSVSLGLLLWYGGGEVLARHHRHRHGGGVQRVCSPVLRADARFQPEIRGHAVGDGFGGEDLPTARYAGRYCKTRKTPWCPSRFAAKWSSTTFGFSYKAGDPVLKGVSFRIAPGEKVAVVGATGSGKTTTIKLLNRSYDIQQGSIKVSGVDVREWDLQALRRHIGVVLQDVFLFSGDVRGNLALGDPSVSQARIEQAARHANADKFHSPAARRLLCSRCASAAAIFPAGNASFCLWRGCWFSGPEIFVMDEATSSVDTETEALIQDALEKVMRDRTCLLIAHRLSTIRNADRIIVLHHGEVREIGSHAELMEKRGIYHRLYQLQYEREELKLTRQ